MTSVEHSDAKAALARENFRRAGLEAAITLARGDAAAALARAPDAGFDLIFLDAERREYPRLWPDLRRALRPGGLLVVDNAISQREEMAQLVALLAADGGFTTSTVPVGKGELLAVNAIH